ncbi:MAG: hypothetical protein F7C35_04350 [Desulfurococcales archaeon]|nr:hypothetical protein [Desulfurococcales archaeon]
MSCTKWPPPRRSKPFYLAVAASVLNTEPTLPLKTIKASEIARAAAIYRADKLIVYRDPYSTWKDYRLLKTLLEYIVTPPHLKKLVFPKDPKLRFAGLIKPLQTPAHMVPDKIRPGTVLDGVVESCGQGTCRILLGVNREGFTQEFRGARPGTIATFKVERVENGVIRLRYYRPSHYWNLNVEGSRNITRLARSLSEQGFLIIGTSRLGRCVGEWISERMRAAKGFLLIFGGPRGHVWDSVDRNVMDVIVNTIPIQGTRTVRTEEAILASLSSISQYFRD